MYMLFCQFIQRGAIISNFIDVVDIGIYSFSAKYILLFRYITVCSSMYLLVDIWMVKFWVITSKVAISICV